MDEGGWPNLLFPVEKILLQATIELRYPMNSGANNAGNQLIQGKFKVGQCNLDLGKTPLFQVIQCHLDPSEGHMGLAAISLFLRDAGQKSFFPFSFFLILPIPYM